MKILIVDDEHVRHLGFKKQYADHELIHCYKVQDAIDALDNSGPFDIIQLDHDMNDWQYHEDRLRTERTGMEVCDYILHHQRENILHKILTTDGMVIIHSWNIDKARMMAYNLNRAEIVVRRDPYKEWTPAQTV